MHAIGRTIFVTLGAALVATRGLNGPARAHDEHQHGGVEAKTKRHHLEAVFAKGGVRLYVHGADLRPVDVSRLTASATFYHPNRPDAWFTVNLKPAAASGRQIEGCLNLAIDLSKVPATGAKVEFQVSRLPDPAEPAATFTVPFILGDDGSITVAKVTKADEKAIAAQKVCPVSGEELGGEMGPPIKLTRGGSTIFLCCKNCLKQVQANPDKFFHRFGGPHSGSDHHGH
jgi:hypothetical protein